MYKLGVIGGMGPLATVKFYDKIVLNTEAHNDNEHIDLIVLNHSTMPDRTKCIIENKDTEFLNEIKKDLEILERIGIDVVAIPCNTSHYFYDEFKVIERRSVKSIRTKSCGSRSCDGITRGFES